MQYHETLKQFLKAHSRGKNHLRTVKAEAAIALGIAYGTDLDYSSHQPGWRLKISEKETKIILKKCEQSEYIQKWWNKEMEKKNEN